MESLLTPIEAAQILGISRSKLYEFLANGAIDSVSLGRSRRFRPEHLEAFVQTRTSSSISARSPDILARA